MNVNTNSDFYSGGINMSDRYQQQNERLTGATENVQRFFNPEPFMEVDRHPITYRFMHEHRPNKSFKCGTLQNVEINAEEMKVQPYQYTRRATGSSSYRDNHDETAKRPCTDDVLIEPPTEHHMSSSVLQNDVRHEPNFHRNLIEVGNELIPMSGVDETSHAHRQGQTIDSICIECNTVLFSLDSASMVVCPYCRFISPLESHSTKKLSPTTNVHAGIGLPIDFVLALK